MYYNGVGSRKVMLLYKGGLTVSVRLANFIMTLHIRFKTINIIVAKMSIQFIVWPSIILCLRII